MEAKLLQTAASLRTFFVLVIAAESLKIAQGKRSDLRKVEIIPANDAVLDEPLAGFRHLLVFFFRL